MKRIFGLAFTAVAASALLVGCGSDDSSSSDGASNDSAAASTGAENSDSAGDDTVITVDGKDLDGLDLDSVTCTKSAGKIVIGSAAIDGKEGVGVVMSDDDPPKVESFGVVYDGSTLGVAPGVGSAEVEVDGDEYTITGTAAGVDMNNPTAGMVKKDFEIVVVCK